MSTGVKLTLIYLLNFDLLCTASIEIDYKGRKPKISVTTFLNTYILKELEPHLTTILTTGTQQTRNSAFHLSSTSTGIPTSATCQGRGSAADKLSVIKALDVALIRIER